MRKIHTLGFMLLIAAFIYGCEGDEIPVENIVEEPVGTIIVDNPKINFTTDGGSVTLEVQTSSEVTRWEAISELTRIETDIDVESGRLTISMEPTEEPDDFSGTVVLYSPNAKSFTIDVTQEGWRNWNERAMAKRMKLKGPVKYVPVHGNPIISRKLFYDLNFDRNGNLNSMHYFVTDRYYPDVPRIEFDIKYDDRNRIISLEGYSPDLRITTEAGTVNMYYKVEFEYGSHDNFVEVTHQFRILQGMHAVNNAENWFPRFLKGLDKMKVYFNGISGGVNNLDFVYGINGNQGTVIVTTVPYGSDALNDQVVVDFKLTNGYMLYQEFHYAEPYTGIGVDQIMQYKVDFHNGNILGYSQDIADLGFAITQAEFYNNIWNLPAMEASQEEYMLIFEYNENYDVESAFDMMSMGTVNYTYEYDKYDNWISLHVDVPYTYTREIEYYE